MAGIFCCSSKSPYRPQRLDYETNFNAFLLWAESVALPQTLDNKGSSVVEHAPYAVQFVQQVNYGPQDCIRYFVPTEGPEFIEIGEDNLVEFNFEKLNSFYKNFRCSIHDKFFEINLYKRNARNTHPWRHNLARPSRDIDLVYRERQDKPSSEKTATAASSNQEPPQNNHLDSPKPATPITFVPLAPELSTNATKRTALKSVLQFLLPTKLEDFRNSSIMSLLCYEWVNREFDLQLSFEDLWKTELTTSNITQFILECLEADTNFNGMTGTAEVQHLVKVALEDLHVASRDHKIVILGMARLWKVTKAVIESESTSEWAPLLEDCIRQLQWSPPKKVLLEHCKNSQHRRSWGRLLESDSDDSGSQNYTMETADWRREYSYEYDQCDSGPEPEDYGYDTDEGMVKDFTVCDKECGYCGKCDD